MILFSGLVEPSQVIRNNFEYHSLFLFYCIYMFVQQRQHDHLSVIDTFSYCLFLLLAHLYVREFNIKFLFLFDRA